tara:strand:- start:19479 stop:20126 length:648 start_codon:yes stop_codon:yes gene_type:complete
MLSHRKTVLTSIAAEETIRLRKNSPLPGRLDSVQSEYFILKSGAVALFASSPLGEKLFLSIVGPGYVFSPSLRSPDLDLKIIMEAKSDVELSVQRYADLGIPDGARTSVEALIAAQQAELLNIAQFHLVQIKQRSSVERTRYALQNYASHLGIPTPCGCISIKLSRAELADWIDISCDRLSRIIRELHVAGHLTVKGHSILIKDACFLGLGSTSL